MNKKTYVELKNRLEIIEKLLNGGKGSGNFGHSGRPGKVGGSGKGGASSDILDEKGQGISKTDDQLREEWMDLDDDVLMSEETKKLLKTYYFGSWFFNNVQKVARQKYLDTMEKFELDKATETMEELDYWIDNSSLNKDVSLYRGITMTDENAEALKVGSVITDSGFASTTLNPSEATRMRGAPTTGGKRNIIVMKINAKEGQRGLKSPVRGDASEYEVVLPRNARFKITGMSDWQRFYKTADDLEYDNKRVRVVEVEYE